MNNKQKKITAKETLLNKLRLSEQEELIKKIETKEYTNFKCKILLLILNKQDILLSFICGFIANLPISVLFNILTIDVAQFKNEWSLIVYFALYGLCLISTAALTIVSFQFTIKYAKVNSEQSNLYNTILNCLTSDTNKKEKSPLAYLTEKLKLCVFFGVCSALSVIALFIINFCVV